MKFYYHCDFFLKNHKQNKAAILKDKPNMTINHIVSHFGILK